MTHPSATNAMMGKVTFVRMSMKIAKASQYDAAPSGMRRSSPHPLLSKFRTCYISIVI